MHIFTQFSPCTGPLINKINNVNILRNLHLFHEYTQQLTVTTKNPLHKGRHTSCLSHRPNVSAFWFSVCPKHCLNATWLKHSKSCYWLKSCSIGPCIFRQGSISGPSSFYCCVWTLDFVLPPLTKTLISSQGQYNGKPFIYFTVRFKSWNSNA
jgi:hypothetical protein